MRRNVPLAIFIIGAGLGVSACDSNDADTTPRELAPLVKTYAPRLEALAQSASRECRSKLARAQQKAARESSGKRRIKTSRWDHVSWAKEEDILQITIDCMKYSPTALEESPAKGGPNAGIGVLLTQLHDQSGRPPDQRIPLNQCPFDPKAPPTLACYDYTKTMISVHHRLALGEDRYVETRVDLSRSVLEK